MREDSNGIRKFCFAFENPKNTVKMPSFVVHMQEMNEMTGIGTMNRDAAVEEFRKLRRRRDNESRVYGVTLIKELRGGGTKPVLITKIIVSSNERGTNSEICVPLDNTNKLKSTYLVYVEASNDYGTSEPSKSFLLTEDGIMHPAK
uniref:Cadherin domain-containing protein n=1 Tax=Meloidogyne hapla TaxID=6305 RepID=A0A1I8BVX2_MELHA